MKKQIIIAILIVVLVVVGIYILQDRVAVSDPTSGWHEYTNDNYKYVLRYPADWAIEINSENTDSITFSDPDDYSQDMTIAIADPEVADVIRGSIDIQEESQITVAGVPATKIISKPAEGGEFVSVIIVEHLGRLYYIAGTADDFDLIIENFRFLE